LAIHLTPSELARETGLGREDIISKCIAWNIPIFNGKIDKTLFLHNLHLNKSEAATA
jgi:hypothetical protein